MTSASGVLDIGFVWAHRITLILVFASCCESCWHWRGTEKKKQIIYLFMSEPGHWTGCKSRSRLTCISGQNGSWRTGAGLKSIQCYTKGPSRPRHLWPHCPKPHKAICRPKGLRRACNSFAVETANASKRYTTTWFSFFRLSVSVAWHFGCELQEIGPS